MTAAAQPAHSSKRFERTVARIASEAFWLKTYHAAICGMTVHAIGLDFFRVSLNSLKDARLIRLMRVLEDDSQTASFWYLVNSDRRRLRNAAKAGGLDLQWLGDVAARLKTIRDKAFVHIDKQGVFDPERFYKAAKLTHSDVETAILGIWRTMDALHTDVFGSGIRGDEYTGADIKQLAALRDESIGIRKAA